MLLDVDTLARSAQIDPTILEVGAADYESNSVNETNGDQFAQKNPSPPLDVNDPAAMRLAMEAQTTRDLALLGPAEPSLIEELKAISMSDGFESTIKIDRPATKPAGGSPLIVLFFGGGFIGGNKDQMTTYSRAFVRLFGAVCVNPSYRIAPEHKFPISQMDACDSTKWLAEHASELGATLSNGFIVGGISAGATCAAVITTKAIEEPLAHPITGQWLCVPSVMNERLVPAKYEKYYLSMEQNKDAPILTAASINTSKKATGEDETSPLRFRSNRTPLHHLRSSRRLTCKPAMLKEAGVKTKIDLYPSCPHAHFGFMPGLEVSSRAVADTTIGVGWLVGKEITAEQGLKAMVSPA